MNVLKKLKNKMSRIIQEKRCSKCRELKNVSEYWKDKTHSTGIRSRCKKCSVKIVKNKNCKHCKTSFKPYTTLDKYCSAKCRIENQKSKRSRNWDLDKARGVTGKNNPSYRNGMYCRGVKKNTKNEKEFIKNSKYLKQKMKDDVGYVFCEDCKTSNSLRFETHHIIFRSEKPNHEHIHKKENLIVLCIECHNNYHKNKGKRNNLVVKRGLDKLFGNDVLDK